VVWVTWTGVTTGVPFVAQVTRSGADAQGIRNVETVYVRATRNPPIAGVDQIAPLEGNP